jgi:hypothetical protein
VTRQIGKRYDEPAVAALEQRVQALEERVSALAEVIRVLVHGLEDHPGAEPGYAPAGDAARRAYDLLLLAEPWPSPPGNAP